MSNQTKSKKYRSRNKRMTAVWLAADPHTDEATLDKMIQVARQARAELKERQREANKGKQAPKD